MLLQNFTGSDLTGLIWFNSLQDLRRWLFLVTCGCPPCPCVSWRSLRPSWILVFFEGVLYLANWVIPLIRDGPSITSSNKNQEEEQDSRFSGKCVPLWRSWKPRECWTWILLAWCLRVRLLGADKGLELQANWALWVARLEWLRPIPGQTVPKTDWWLDEAHCFLPIPFALCISFLFIHSI